MNELELNSQLSNIDFKQKVINQLKKDFALIGYEINLYIQATTVELIDTLALKLIEIEELKPSDLVKIAYVVDLGEDNYKKATTKEENNKYRELAFQILKRDAFKVYLREKY